MHKPTAWLIILTLGLAFAHADLTTADPPPGSMLPAPPESITLRFSEPVEVRYSTFRVYPLELPGDLTLEDLTDVDERERQRLSALAAALVDTALETHDDDDARADTGILTQERMSTDVTLGLHDELPAGVYVVMWDALSLDTHWTRGHYLLFVNPLEY